jgi:hypothetical protein
VWKASGKGYRLGWTRAAWRLQGLQLLMLPVMVQLWGVSLLPAAAALGQGAFMGHPVSAARMTAAVLLALLGASFVYLPVSFIGGLVQIARRAMVIEDLGVFAGLRRAWQVLRGGAKEVLALWLLLAALELGYFFVAAPIAAALSIIGMVLAWLTGGAVFLALESIVTMEAAFGLAVSVGLLVLGVVMGLPLLLADGLWSSYVSVAWTHTYRGLAGGSTPHQ